MIKSFFNHFQKIRHRSLLNVTHASTLTNAYRILFQTYESTFQVTRSTIWKKEREIYGWLKTAPICEQLKTVLKETLVCYKMPLFPVKIDKKK